MTKTDKHLAKAREILREGKKPVSDPSVLLLGNVMSMAKACRFSRALHEITWVLTPGGFAWKTTSNQPQLKVVLLLSKVKNFEGIDSVEDELHALIDLAEAAGLDHEVEWLKTYVLPNVI